MFTVTYYEMAMGISIYCFMNHYLNELKLDLSKSNALRICVFIHNLILTLYSGWTFYHTVRFMSNYSYSQILGPESIQIFSNPTYRNLLYLFYLSKYYEFFDTWIHYVKGRTPIFLQIYHHIGAVIIVGAGYKHEVVSMWIFLAFNSFVHTLMYYYYTLSTLKVIFPLKYLLTTLQITQFVSGMSLNLYYWWATSMNFEQQICILVSSSYLIGLIYLFRQFYVKSYVKKHSK